MRQIAATLLIAISGVVGAAQQGPGIAVRPLFDNPSVGVARLLLLPGAREMPHAHGYPLLIVSISRGDVEFLKGTATNRSMWQVGDLQLVERDVRHAGANMGTMPVEALAISIKPDRVKGGTAPPLPRPTGITSTDVLDSADAAVRRVELAPGAREVPHTHPYDFVVVPVVSGRMEVQLAGKTETKDYAPGDAFFIARNTPHAVANVGKTSFALLGVTIK
jgi:quercetin dioxygenase-like cupin family protein